ncbi:unnamed protein product [Rhizoctonia solani]|uniref:BTB domain-containing protein n=1 Tax=Rhizoctonia solani TaxID=456999 RepID=A0A8H3DA10_9AGAM|nr:unnamed protein product [Rhizoctonia solani]
MTGSLTRITSPPFVYYVPSFDKSSDSDSEGWEELEVNSVVEGSMTSRSSCKDNCTTQVCGISQENDIIHRSPSNPDNQQTTSTYPGPPGESSSSPSLREYCVSFRDGNIRLLVGTEWFLLHEHKLEQFSGLKKTIKGARENGAEPGINHKTRSILQLHLDENPTDFSNMLKILYLPVYEDVGPDDHSDSVLKSTLRLATKFQHPVLRSYAIRCLEKRKLTPIERIELARDSDISSWFEEGLNELCTRKQAITLGEAEILGMKTFVELVSRREAHKLSSKPKAPSSSEATFRSESTQGLVTVGLTTSRFSRSATTGLPRTPNAKQPKKVDSNQRWEVSR